MPDGYFAVRPSTYGNWMPFCSFLVDGSPKPGVDLVKRTLKVYPLGDAANLRHIPKLVADGTAVLIAEQNMLKALEIADRAYVLRNGRIVQEGPAAALKADPLVRDAFLGGR